MKNKEIQLAIVAKNITDEILEYYIKTFPEYHILVVSPEPVSTRFLNEIFYKNDTDFLNRKQIFELFSDISHQGLREKRLIPSWYYQQLLKYNIVLLSEFKYTHIIDGDSLVSPILVQKEVLYFTRKPANHFYREFNRVLLGRISDSVIKFNFITNQMLFNKALLKKLIQLIEKKMQMNWIDAISNILKENEELMFSEYQLYSEYAIASKKHEMKKISVFRRMDLISGSIIKAQKKYQVVSFEQQHKTTFFRILRAKLYYSLGISLG